MGQEPPDLSQTGGLAQQAKGLTGHSRKRVPLSKRRWRGWVT